MIDADARGRTEGQTRGRKKSRRRADIQGLRAVAILAVVAYHGGLPVPGGYVGVDVFFVISGYLITPLLFEEVAAGGRLSFAGFYGRRARRLLPSAVLVIVVTVVASVLVLGPARGEGDRQGRHGVRALRRQLPLRVPSDQLPQRAGPVSPLQNYWSLGVEEQFYLVWPLLLLAAYAVGRRSRGRHRRTSADSRLAWAVIGTLAIVGALSFWLCVSLTKANQPWAFFSLPTRAWELAVGGLLALAVPDGSTAPGAGLWRRSAGSASAPWGSRLSAFGPQTPFPGPAATDPGAGTGAALVAGTRSLTVRAGAAARSWLRCRPSAPSRTPGTSGIGRR